MYFIPYLIFGSKSSMINHGIKLLEFQPSLLAISLTAIVMFQKKFSFFMSKKKLPRWIRILRYNLNCIWFHVLMPVGMPEDDFSKHMKSK